MGKPGTAASELSVGIQFDHVKNIREKLDMVVEKNINYICSRLVPEQAFDHCVETGVEVPCPEFWKDAEITTKEWSLGLVTVLSNPPELESEDLLIRNRATKALNRELEYSHHLSVSAIMFELTRPSNNLAQLIQGRLHQSAQHFTFWMKVRYGASGPDGDIDEDTDYAWKCYNTFRKLCCGERKLMVVLQLAADIPDDNSKLDRWKGEMVTALSIPLSIFLTNDKGFPVLSKPHQAVVRKFLALGVHMILEADIAVEDNTLEFYAQYLRHLHATQIESFKDPASEERYYMPGWENYLQCPLQPLMDNLENQTYATFEVDPVKYQLYRDALALAFRKKIPSGEQRAATELVVVVAGAGRGPLVNMTLEAAVAEGVQVRVYALEKNSSARMRLEDSSKTKWEGKVTVAIADMRYWNAPEKADIIVSELLGSFGDNELSPECLDGAQRFLKPDGIIIPEEYTSFLAPIMSHTLHAEASKYREWGKPYESPYETTYVCLMTRKYDISQPKELFKFSHPADQLEDSRTGPMENSANDRYKTLEFDVRQDCECHGFAGYFDSVLLSDVDTKTKVTMSIHPDTYSGKMQSWFPLYIPIKNGISLRKGDKLLVSFWRKSTSTKVWYEWSVAAPEALPIHNVNGRSQYLGLDLATAQ